MCNAVFYIHRWDNPFGFWFFYMLHMIIFEAFYQKENLKKLPNTWLMFVGWGVFFWSFAFSGRKTFRSQVSWYKEKQCKEQHVVDEWTLLTQETGIWVRVKTKSQCWLNIFRLYIFYFMLLNLIFSCCLFKCKRVRWI